MTFNRKLKIKIIKGLRQIFKINKYNSDEISRYGSYALLASYWPKPWKFILTSILCKYQKQIQKNKVRNEQKEIKNKKKNCINPFNANKNVKKYYIPEFWR